MQQRRLAAATLCAVLVPVCSLAAAKFDLLYSFKGGKDGAIPLPGSGAALISDGNGALYGVSAGLDTSTDFGTVFKLTPPAAGKKKWGESVLYRFKGGADGWYPDGTLLPDGAGGFYGSSFAGGTGGCVPFSPLIGCGLVFHLAPSQSGKGAWAETVIYTFLSGNDGAAPTGALIADTSGALYGMTGAGGGGACNFGVPGCGTVFKLTPPAGGRGAWTETILYAFQPGAGGSFPEAGLTADAKGNLYGALSYGGVGCNGIGCGVVFKLAPPKSGQTAWTNSVLYTFLDGNDGAYPQPAPVFGAHGTLLGTAAVGGIAGYGTVFELTPPAKGGTGWTETTLHSFLGGADGAQPNAGLSALGGGAFVTTSYFGGTGPCALTGAPTGCGTVVKLTPPGAGSTSWTESVLHTFADFPDGDIISGGLLVDSSGAIFGAATSGGLAADCDGYGCGTVFRIK